MGTEKGVRQRGDLLQTRIATESSQTREEQRDFLDREGWSDALQINECLKKGKERERESEIICQGVLGPEKATKPYF